MRDVRLGTRGSALARWQTDYVIGQLQHIHINTKITSQIISTKGDQILDKSLPLIGGKGLFTAELERALLAKEIDGAVHSLKDLPTANPEGLIIGAVPKRASVGDVLVSRKGHKLNQLPYGATIGTSSRRRAAQLLNHRPDLNIMDIRGNVETRINKVLDPDGQYDGTILAHAGLERLELMHHAAEILSPEIMLNAPGQGALGVQCRKDEESSAFFKIIQHRSTWLAVTAERAFLAGLEGGCAVPVAALATMEKGELHLQGRVSAVDGSTQIEVSRSIEFLFDMPEVEYSSAWQFGLDLAKEAVEQGAGKILTAIR